MSVPPRCTVLVIGGGPGGSYAASVLARDEVDVVVLEADVFPRYHIGESMLASMRYFLRFIDLEDTFDQYGFVKKYGATFKVTAYDEAYTNFSASLGPGGHAWNVVRSESDDLIFKHAAKSGAKTFDGTKITDIQFVPCDAKDFPEDPDVGNPGRPVSATWTRKDGTSGTINFDYLIDASGRAGLMSTKYLKNRTVNLGLKNLANWTYWKAAGPYAPGTERENSPFFECLNDGSGWCWAIPLHNGTLSVGVVMRQDLFFNKKKELGSPPSMELYKQLLNGAPNIKELLENGETVSDVKMASDWSYSASCYAGPNFRIVGDAGCFIDPYFSSGVHLALTGGLSAAATIQGSRKGQTSEFNAAKWHTTKVTEGYTRFLLVVMTILRQLRKQERSVSDDGTENGFEVTFGLIQPVIQGTADSEPDNSRTQQKTAAGVDFVLNRFQADTSVLTPENQKHVLNKVQAAGQETGELEKLNPEEVKVLHNMVRKQLRSTVGDKNLSGMANGVLHGYKPIIERGNLGMIKVNVDEEGNEIY